MSDWLTHVIVGLVLAEVFGFRRKTFVVIGAILPDLLIKINYIHYFMPGYNLYPFLLPFHAPLGALLIGLLIVTFFRNKIMFKYCQITLGIISHFVLDIMFKMAPVYLLYPFSMRPFSLEIFWANEYYILLLYSVLVLVMIYLIKFLKRGLYSLKDG